MTTYSPVKAESFALTELNFAALDEFLEYTANEDRQFFLEEELYAEPTCLAPVVCGMANSAGGWIITGAAWDGAEKKSDVHGVSDMTALRERLTLVLSEQFSTQVPVSLYSLNNPAPLLLLHVWPVLWHHRPVCVNGDYVNATWRRIEGVNVASGLQARFRLGMDALERSRSDYPMAGIKIEDLHPESVAAFREAVLQRKPEWSALSIKDFLSRALVMSGESVTRAGYFLLGRQAVRVRVEIRGVHSVGGAAGNTGIVREETRDEIFEVRNLWRAWSDLLPRFTRSLSDSCAAAFCECFVNALIHAEHDAGKISIIISGSSSNPESELSLSGASDGVRALFENPGLARAWRSGESECRNFRLMKIFQLIGAARGTGEGLAIIRDYAPLFRLEQNILELSTVAVLRLEPRPVSNDIVTDEVEDAVTAECEGEGKSESESDEHGAAIADNKIDDGDDRDNELVVTDRGDTRDDRDNDNIEGQNERENREGKVTDADEGNSDDGSSEDEDDDANAQISFGNAEFELANLVAAIKNNGGNI